MHIKRKTEITGKAALWYVYCLNQDNTGGLDKYWINKGGGNPDKTTKNLSDKIDGHYNHGYFLQYDVQLNRFMVD